MSAKIARIDASSWPREILVMKRAVGYLGLLGWVHVWVFRAAFRDLLRFWWVWALLGFGVRTHRRQILATKLLPG